MIKGLSPKELEVISFLEFEEKYFFKRDDVKQFFKNKTIMNYYIHKLMKKKRVVKINKEKYFLIPIKAKKGFWAEHPLIIVDEVMNSGDYFIGGNYAKYYWKLIEQIPREVEVFTTRRLKNKIIFNIKIIFRHTTERNLRNSTREKIEGHPFKIATKAKAKEF